MYAVLGDIQFELITYFDGLDASFSADFAEHRLIGRKPRLQWVGDGLDEIRIELRFHAAYCDPEAELAKLITGLRSHRARQLVFGNGQYKGWFVATAVEATTRHSDGAGTLIALEARVTLREYIQPADPAARAAQAKADARGRVGSAPKRDFGAGRQAQAPSTAGRPAGSWATDGRRGAAP